MLLALSRRERTCDEPEEDTKGHACTITLDRTQQRSSVESTMDAPKLHVLSINTEFRHPRGEAAIVSEGEPISMTHFPVNVHP